MTLEKPASPGAADWRGARCVLFAYHEAGFACMEALIEMGAPVIALFSMARAFIERRLPQLTIQTSVAPQFVVIDRPVAGPLVLVGCDATKTGDLDVPFDLESREFAIDATAAFVQPHEVRLAEVTVLKVQDRSLRLGFTLGGVRSPPGVPLTCPQGQALVSLRVNVAVVRALQ